MSRVNFKLSAHFPAQAFFNAIPDRLFVETIAGLAQGQGAGFNDSICWFPNEADPADSNFDGVMFGLFEEEVVVDSKRFSEMLFTSCAGYLKAHPEDKMILERLLSNYASP